MIGRKHFDQIRARNGFFASWAVWADAGVRPKSNVGELGVLDPDSNPSLLEVVKDDVVMAGLNISRTFSEPFRNFHDPSPKAHDFKIRYAFSNTPFYGAYMTDIIKGVEMVKSGDLLEHLRATPSLVRENAKAFVDELKHLTSKRPTILAFGRDAERLIAANVPSDAYKRLVGITHYSHRISKEEYRRVVLDQIG